ncbi:MAG: tandem-95 repeat protein [Planctomycetaceae bacterium]|nr:tandem-95 repeat protein [Planctomycetaceae bacterium]
MRLSRAWDSFWGAFGLVRRNRRGRKAAAARRRSMYRRHRFDSLEQRVVLNADPVAADDYYTVSAPYGGGWGSYDVSWLAPDLGNDSDPDGDALQLEPFNAGTIVGVPGDTFTFAYTITDGNGGSSTANVHVTITEDAPPPENQPPVVTDFEHTVPVPFGSGGATIYWDDYQPSAGDYYDPEGHGVNLVWTPYASEWIPSGSYGSYAYTVEDADGGVTTGYVRVHVVEEPEDVQPPGPPPTVGDDYQDVYVSASGEWIDLANYSPYYGNDSAWDGSGLTPVNCSNYGQFYAVPGGSYSFGYSVMDSWGQVGYGTVTLNFVPNVETPPNTPPWAATGQAFAVDVTHNQTSDVTVDSVSSAFYGDADGDWLTVVVQPITLSPGQTGTLYFSVSDGYETAYGSLDVTINVLPNRGPVANDDSLSIDEDTPGSLQLGANDWDEDGDTLTFSLVAPAQYGVAVVDAGGLVTYTPNSNVRGTDSFTYRVDDGCGGVTTATVYVTVAPVDDPLVAVDDTIVAAGGTVSFTQDQLTANENVDDEPLEIVGLHGRPQHGSLTWHSDGSFTYQAVAGYLGTDSFQYDVTDGASTSRATVTINVVGPVNAAPTFTVNDFAVPASNPYVMIDDWASGISAGSANEAGQSLNFQVTLGSAAEQELFAVVPQVDSEGTLWFVPSGVAGIAHVTVVLCDNGGTAYGGVDQSEPYTFTITLSDPGTYPAAEVDSELPVVQFAENSRSVAVREDVAGGKAVFTVTLSEPAGEEVAVLWHTEAGTASAGIHYDALGGTLTFAAGQTTALIEIPLINDSLERGVVTEFKVVLDNPLGARVGDEAVAQVQLEDDDVTVSISDANPASEGPDAELVFYVTLSRASAHTLTVDYSTADLSAAAGQDFTATSGSVVFAPGELMKEIRVSLINDSDNVLDSSDPELKRGEGIEQVAVVLNSVDPHVMVGAVQGVGTIYDDDWQRNQIVGYEPGYTLEWYGSEGYQSGDVINLDPDAVVMNGATSFVVPDDWTGQFFYVSNPEPVYSWESVAPEDALPPGVTIEALNSSDAGEGSGARFRIHLVGAAPDQTVTVHYATHGQTAEAGGDFTSTNGSVDITGDGYADVEIPVLLDALTEMAETFSVYITSATGALLSPLTYMAAMQIPPIKITSVQFLRSEDSAATTGYLDGRRFYPDSLLGEEVGRNIVRVRAVVTGLAPGDRIYFQSYDVDDISRLDRLDKNGNDNFGRLDLEIDPTTGDILNNSHLLPGEPKDDGAGFAGLMRGVDVDGNGGAWRGFRAGEKPLVSSIVRADPITGELYAEADLLTSFQPGDNFRVLAIPQQVGGDPNWDPNDGVIHPDIVAMFEELDLTNSTTTIYGTTQPKEYGARGTDIINIWRRLHVEFDHMSSNSD